MSINEKIINILHDKHKDENAFVSGEEIAKIFDVSRTAV